MDTVENGVVRRRIAQAAATRVEIVMAAGRLMLEHGYVGTSVAMIAAEAGVVVQTIYNSVGSKAELLAAVLERVAEEPDAPALLSPQIRGAIASAPNRTAGIRIVARSCFEVNERTSGLIRVVSEAAVVDPDVAEFERRRDVARLRSFGEMAAALCEKRPDRAASVNAASSSSDPEIAATIWAIAHPRAYRALVVDVGWSREAYLNWLEKALGSALH